MGKEAQNAYESIKCKCANSGLNILIFPHPNARAKNGKWGIYSMNDFKIESKIKIISEKIKEAINDSK